MRKFFIDFVITFLTIYLIYLILNRGRKSFEKLKSNSEVLLVIQRYKLNMKKIKYKRLLNIISIINSFIIAVGSTIVINIDSFVFSLIISFIVIFVLIFLLYGFLGSYYKKKGMTYLE